MELKPHFRATLLVGLVVVAILGCVTGCSKMGSAPVSDPRLSKRIVGVWYTSVQRTNDGRILYQEKIFKADETTQNSFWTKNPDEPPVYQDIPGRREPLEDWKVQPGKLYWRTQGLEVFYNVTTFRFIDDNQFAVPNTNMPHGETIWRRTDLPRLKSMMETGEGVISRVDEFERASPRDSQMRRL